MSKQIAIYYRVSGNKQDHRSQEPDLEQWVKTHAGSSKVVYYRDKASGKSMDRPAWNRLQEALNKGQVKQLVTWRIDRLGRTASGLSQLFEDLHKRKVNLVSLKDGLDLSTPAGRMMANVLGSMAEFENEVRTERIRAGQQVARDNGKRWGGSKKGRKLSLTNEQEDQVVRLAKEGTNKSAIARATGVSRPWVYEILRRHNLHASKPARV